MVARGRAARSSADDGPPSLRRPTTTRWASGRSVRTLASASSRKRRPLRATSAEAVVMIRPGTTATSGRGRNSSVSTPTGTTCSRAGSTPNSRDDVRAGVLRHGDDPRQAAGHPASACGRSRTSGTWTNRSRRLRACSTLEAAVDGDRMVDRGQHRQAVAPPWPAARSPGTGCRARGRSRPRRSRRWRQARSEKASGSGKGRSRTGPPPPSRSSGAARRSTAAAAGSGRCRGRGWAAGAAAPGGRAPGRAGRPGPRRGGRGRRAPWSGGGCRRPGRRRGACPGSRDRRCAGDRRGRSGRPGGRHGPPAWWPVRGHCKWWACRPARCPAATGGAATVRRCAPCVQRVSRASVTRRRRDGRPSWSGEIGRRPVRAGRGDPRRRRGRGRPAPGRPGSGTCGSSPTTPGR